MTNILNQKNNDLGFFTKFIENLCTQERIESYDPHLVIVPDFLNDETAPIYSGVFSNIKENNDSINRVIIITESLLPQCSKRKLIIPNFNDNIANTIVLAQNEINELKQNILVNTDSSISFTSRLEAIIPFIQFLMPNKPVLPLLNNGLKSSEIYKCLSPLNITKQDLIIVLASLSVGLSKPEAVSSDTALVTTLISQEDEIKIKSTPYAAVLNVATKLSNFLRLRPRFFKYITATHQGRKVIKVKGICSIGYFY